MLFHGFEFVRIARFDVLLNGVLTKQFSTDVSLGLVYILRHADAGPVSL